MLDAAHEAQETTAVDPNAEVRIIESDPLKIAALWLHGKNGFVRPYLGLPSDRYSEARFRNALAERLHHIRAQYCSAAEKHGEPGGN